MGVTGDDFSCPCLKASHTFISQASHCYLTQWKNHHRSRDHKIILTSFSSTTPAFPLPKDPSAKLRLKNGTRRNRDGSHTFSQIMLHNKLYQFSFTFFMLLALCTHPKERNFTTLWLRFKLYMENEKLNA